MMPKMLSSVQNAVEKLFGSIRLRTPISKAAAGVRGANNMETIQIDMQGWFAVIKNGELVAAFVQYEDALVYRRTIQGDEDDVIVEKITHHRG